MLLLMDRASPFLNQQNHFITVKEMLLIHLVIMFTLVMKPLCDQIDSRLLYWHLNADREESVRESQSVIS